MPTFTKRLNLEKPKRGEYLNTWDIPLNANFDKLDQYLGEHLENGFVHVHVGTYPPSHPETEGPAIWLDTSSSPPVLKVWDSVQDSWVIITGGGVPGANRQVEYHQITQAELDAGCFDLTKGTPVAPAEVILCPIGGIPQQYGVDFSVSGRTINLYGDLLNDLADGDWLRVVYET